MQLAFNDQVTMALHVSDHVVCPPHAMDGYFSSDDRVPYITQIMTPSASAQHLLALCDDARILLFDKTQLAAPYDTIRAPEEEAFTALSNIESNNNAWMGTSVSGYVAVWDARAPTMEPQMRLTGPSKSPYLSVASNGMYVATGTELKGSDAMIDVWDLRQTSTPVHTYSEVHSDDITSLVFHPDRSQHANILLSGGMDGLICATDTSIKTEEDAVVSVGNTNASLARVGWAAYPTSYCFTPSVPVTDVDMDDHDQQLVNNERWHHLGPVYAISNMQTLSLWDADKFDCIKEGVEVRKPTSFRPPWVTDYVIDACASGPLSQRPAQGPSMHMYMGDQEGGMALVSAEAQDHDGIVMEWTMHARLPSTENHPKAHADIVRCVEWDEASRRLYTGGEDGRLLAWSFETSDSPVTPQAVMNTSTSSIETPPAKPARRPRPTGHDTLKRRYSPYA